MKWIRQFIDYITGRQPDPPHKVVWRRNETGDGIVWERIHFPKISRNEE
jgi:hypothetical protein